MRFSFLLDSLLFVFFICIKNKIFENCKQERKKYIFLLKLTILQTGRLAFSCLDIMFKERKLGFSMIIIITWYVNISKYQRRLHSLFSVSQMLFRVFLPVHSLAKLDLWAVIALVWSPSTRSCSVRNQPAWRGWMDRSGANGESSCKTTLWDGRFADLEECWMRVISTRLFMLLPKAKYFKSWSLLTVFLKIGLAI